MLNSNHNAKNSSLLLIALAVLFIFPAASAYASWPEKAKLLASDAAAGDYFGYSVSVSGDYAIVGAYGDDDDGSSSGSAYVFTPNNVDPNNWDQVAKLTALDAAADDEFGYSVSISGDYAIVGAYGDDSYSGSAYIFTPNDVDPNNWDQVAKLTAADAAAGDGFGYSVSASGDYAIVGAPGDDDNGSYSGSAYIFYYNGTNWSQQAKLLADDGAADDWFGNSVSISGDYAIVGAFYDDDDGSSSGSAYVFKRSGTSWSQQAKLLAGDGTAGDWFGISVSISGDYAIVGAEGDDTNGPDSGSAYIFYRNHGGTDNWGQQAKLLASDGAGGDGFGISVSISGDYAVVGAYGDNDSFTDSGSAYIFKRSATIWSQQGKLLAVDAAEDDQFGVSVSVSGNYAVVGAFGNDDSGSNSGSAYIYLGLSEIHGTKWHDIDGDGRLVEDIDEQEQVLPGWLIYIDVNENGQFDAGEPNDITDANGNYVLTVLSGTYVVAEQNEPCWEQTYPGGDGTYSVTLEGGEVATGYNFGNARPTEIHPSAWQQEEQDKLVASDGAAGDYFGTSVSISGDYAIVGASFDDLSSGSAYIFAPNNANCGDWDEAVKLTASDAAADDEFGISVSVSGDYAIVGAYKEDDNGDDSGSAYIFYYDGASWSQQDKLTASDGSSGDNFGRSVSISGDYAVVGAYNDDDNGSSSGSAYIFAPNDVDPNNWDQQAKLLAADAAVGDRFGYSVSVSGDYAVVGAYNDDDNGNNSGSAYIFKRDGTSWSEQAKLLAADGAADDYFGFSVSIRDDYAVVGARYDDDSGSDSGSAYIFKRDGTSWSEQAKLLASDGSSGDDFGRSVSISGDYAIVGAYGDDDGGANSGSAYLFKRSGTSWSQQAKLLASDGTSGDYFGWSVSVSGDYVIAGAYGDDDSGADSGSAYMFGKALCPSMDGTGDCFVNFEDFAIMAGQWLQGVE